MSYRIFMRISRGMTDATAICVYPWEKALVEEVHGGAAIVTTIDEMCNLQGGKAKPIKPPIASKHAREKEMDKVPSLREQLEAMCVVDPEADPIHDLEAEWGRMIDKYGMHIKIPITNAEKVYGNFGIFRRFCLAHKGTKPPVEEVEIGMGVMPYQGDDTPAEDKPIAELDRAELVKRLTKEGVQFKRNASIEKLRELAETALA